MGKALLRQKMLLRTDNGEHYILKLLACLQELGDIE
jgi:hypothetical protein